LLFWGVVRIIIEGVIIGAFVMFADNPIEEKLLIFFAIKEVSTHPTNISKLQITVKIRQMFFFKNEIEFY
jgi:hypothetical protein